MSISTFAKKVIEQTDENINTEWLVLLNEDEERGVISKYHCYQLIKAYIYGIMATRKAGIEVICDIDNFYIANYKTSTTKEKCRCGSSFYDDRLGMCQTCFDHIKHDESGCDDGERYF